MSGKIICLSEVRLKKSGGCDHFHMLVDADIDTIECQDCGEKLNPIQVLVRFANEETRYERRKLEAEKSLKKLKGRKRTKCNHCGNMTPIRY